MDNLCEEMNGMNIEEDNFYDRCYDADDDFDCENEKPEYFAGFYVLWKGEEAIFADYFIFDSEIADDEYKADKQLWRQHEEDMKLNPFSQLNESIGNLKDIELYIIDSHLFEEEDYEKIKSMLVEKVEDFRQEYKDNDEGFLYKKKTDAYNMTELLDALETCIMMDDLFGEEDE